VKLEKPLEEKKVYYADLWGLRSEKYKYLFENDVKSTDWLELEPRAPYYFFVPKDFVLQEEYEKFWKVTEIFKEWSSGMKTRRDKFMVAFSKEELLQRLKVFVGNLSDEIVCRSLGIKDTKYWGIKKAREEVRKVDLGSKIEPYAYRPFDNQFVFYFPNIIERGDAREPLMKHFLKENIALVSTRILSQPPFKHVFVSDSISDMCLISIKTKEASYYFPLYIYPEEPKGKQLVEKTPKPERTPNFTAKFLQAVKSALDEEPTPEEIFYYIYAVLYSPSYRKRYEEFLKIDFPRVPLPEDYEKFKKLSELGKELVELHLLRHHSLGETGVGFTKEGTNVVEKVRYDEETERVYFNKDQYFEGISKEVWEYRIGAYQVMAKYLKDRKGRKLSLEEIEHYMKATKAIERTIEVQGRVEEVLEELEGRLEGVRQAKSRL
jgi:predicted helicase